MTKNEMQILVLLLTDLKEQETEKGQSCERDIAALSTDHPRYNGIKGWAIRHLKCAEASESVIEILNYYILNHIYAEREIR